MKFTIKNKLILGIGLFLLLGAMIAVTGAYSVIKLRSSSQEVVLVGDRLNALALEIQVHNQIAQRRVNAYFLAVPSLGQEEARAEYLDEAKFEIHELQSLASKAVKLSSTEEVRAPFKRLQDDALTYSAALERSVVVAGNNPSTPAAKEAFALYADAAEKLNNSAEDGEIKGRETAEVFQKEIERVSKQCVYLEIGLTILGLVIAIPASYKLYRSILVPVQHLTQVAESVSLGDLNIEVHRYSDDEIGDLADSFSRMLTAVKFFKMEADERA